MPNYIAPPKPELVLGVDLGKSRDFSAIALVEHIRPVQRDDPERFDVTHAARWELDTPYPRIVADTMALARDLTPDGMVTIAIDKTGVGAPVLDLFIDALRGPDAIQPAPSLFGIFIHGGNTVIRDGRGFNVPKRDLVHQVQTTLQTGLLTISPDIPETPTLTAELAAFDFKLDARTGHDVYGAAEDWRDRSHDDLVLAVAIATWMAKQRPHGATLVAM